jgi:hypothetical protein
MSQDVRQQDTASPPTSTSPLAITSTFASAYRWPDSMPTSRSSCSRRGSPTCGSPPDQRFEFDLNMAFCGPKELWAERTPDEIPHVRQ